VPPDDDAVSSAFHETGHLGHPASLANTEPMDRCASRSLGQGGMSAAVELDSPFD
jgi:hypothetical protein